MIAITAEQIENLKAAFPSVDQIYVRKLYRFALGFPSTICESSECGVTSRGRIWVELRRGDKLARFLVGSTRNISLTFSEGMAHSRFVGNIRMWQPSINRIWLFMTNGTMHF